MLCNAKALFYPFFNHTQWGHQAQFFNSDPNCPNKCYSRSSATQCTLFNKWLQVIQIKLLFKSFCAAKRSYYFRMNQYWVVSMSAMASPVRDEWFLVVGMCCWDIPTPSMAILTSLDSWQWWTAGHMWKKRGENRCDKSLKEDWKPGMCFSYLVYSMLESSFYQIQGSVWWYASKYIYSRTVLK